MEDALEELQWAALTLGSLVSSGGLDDPYSSQKALMFSPNSSENI